MSEDRAQFVIVGEADCEAGKFLDEVSREARRSARTVEVQGSNPPPPAERPRIPNNQPPPPASVAFGARPDTAEVIAELVVAVRQSQDVLDYFARFASAEERQIADARLARNREALSLYRRWVTP